MPDPSASRGERPSKPLLSEDAKPISLVPEKVRDAWGSPKKKAYTRDQYEADKKARERRDG